MATRKLSSGSAVFALACLACSGAWGGEWRRPDAIKPVRSPEQHTGPRVGQRLVQVTNFIRAAEARQQYNVDGAGLTVAVLDTGLNTSHVDFAGRVAAQVNYTSDNGGNQNNATDGDGHGTNVGGIICAGADHIGMAPGARIVPIKVLSNNGSGTFTAIENGLLWVINNRATYNISVVNMSLGSATNDTTAPPTSDTMRARIRTLRDAGVVVCVAAGNDFYEFNSQQGMGYPANIPECISVGAVFDANVGQRSYGGPIAYSTAAGRITPFSQRLHESVSSTVRTDIFAPGAPVTSSGISGTHGESTQDGTSQATPVTAGVILLMQQLYLRQNGSLPSVDQLEGWLRSGGVSINDGDDEDDNVANTGRNFIRLDALSALQAVAGGAPPPPPQAPVITAQPASQTVTVGQGATFQVAASGSGLSYQWQVNNANIGGATSSSYTFANAQLSDSGKVFRCVVSNGSGSATSNGATLTVQQAQSGAVALQNGVGVSSSVTLNAWKHYYLDVPAGATSLTVATTGASADVDLYVRLGSQPDLSTWNFRPYTASGNESVQATATTNPSIQAGRWYCSVHGYAAGNFTITATYIVPNVNHPPAFLSGLSVVPNPAQVGQTVTFTALADDEDGDPLSYSWSFSNGGSASGASVTRVFNSAGTYTGTVTVSDGQASIGDSIQVVVLAPVAITGQPGAQTVSVGQSAAFQVTATGSALNYQWQVNGANIGGATSSSYTFANAQLSDSGKVFRCVVSNTLGSATSDGATLTVQSAPPPPPPPPPGDAQELQNGVSVASSVSYHVWRDFYIEAPAGATNLTIRTTNANADVDLYVRRGSLPELDAYDFRPYTDSGNETVQVTASTNPALQAGRWYVSVYGYAAGSFTLTATYTVPNANTPPFFTAGVGAAPNPAQAGQAVQFSASAGDSDGDTLSYSWSFGDGSNGAGANPAHAYAAAGTYTATVTVSDGQASISASAQVVVEAAGGGAEPLQLTRMILAVNFRLANRDTASVQGYLPVDPLLATEGLAVQVNLGGVQRTFTLDRRGMGRIGEGSFRLLPRSNGRFVLTLRGNFASDWADEGMLNATVRYVPVRMPIQIVVDGQAYEGERTLSYTATAGRSGQAR